MNKLLLRRFAHLMALLFLLFAFTSCGSRSKVEGTYSQGGGAGTITLDLKSDGKATFTMMGEDYACAYKIDGNKLALDCTPKGERVDLTIHDDGSLTGPSFIGVLKKSK